MNQLRNLANIQPFWHKVRLHHSTTKWSKQCFHTSTAVLQKEPKLDEPIKYSGSEAREWKSYKTFTAPMRDRPWYQPYSVLISVTIFLVYFCILREENDIDESIGTSLYARIPGLEEIQLEQAIEYNKKNGMSTEALEARLKEIHAQR